MSRLKYHISGLIIFEFQDCYFILYSDAYRAENEFFSSLKCTVILDPSVLGIQLHQKIYNICKRQNYHSSSLTILEFLNIVLQDLPQGMNFSLTPIKNATCSRILRPFEPNLQENQQRLSKREVSFFVSNNPRILNLFLRCAISSSPDVDDYFKERAAL